MTKRKLDAILRNGRQLKQVRLDLEIKKALEDAGFKNVKVRERGMSLGICKDCGSSLKIMNVNHRGVLYCPNCPKEIEQ